MEKKSVQAVGTVVFSFLLYVGAVAGANTQSGEIGQIQDAMRELKRVDNLQFSYQTRFFDSESESIQEADTWLDMLTGAWVSEHSNTDEDGTLLYLRQYFDGDNSFEYITTRGEWHRTEDGNTQVMNLGALTSIPYKKEDIADISVTEEEGICTISFSPTRDYMERMKQELLEDSRLSYSSYEKMDIPKAAVEAARIGIERYENTSEEQIVVSYMIDPKGVLCGMDYSGTMIQPEVVTGEDGEFNLGEAASLNFEISVKVKAYNDDMILNKIETYALDVRGVE